MSVFSFLFEFIKNPRDTGGIVPSSASLGKAISALVAQNLKPDSVIVEVGAGTGSLTRHLSELPAPIIAVEANAKLGAVLKSRYPQVELIPAFIQDAVPTIREKSAGKSLVIVSSLPFVSLPRNDRNRIRDLYRAFLDESPHNLIVQYTYKVGDPIDFSEAGATGITATREKTVIKNIPPAHVWTYRKAR